MGEWVMLGIDDLQHQNAFFCCRASHKKEKHQQYGRPTTIALTGQAH